MDLASGRTRRALVGSAAVAVGVSALILLSGRTRSMAAQQQSNFMGGNPEVLDIGDVRTLRLRFPAGSRSNWHTHTDGQLLMLESGRGLTQVRGQPVYEMHAGEPWWTPAGVEHWHGAHPDEASVQLTIYGGSVNWLDPVTDEQYHVASRRP